MLLLAVAALSFLDSNPVKVAGPDSVQNAQEPQAAVSAKGTVYVAFGSNDTIYLSKSLDRGKTFESASKVASPEDLKMGMRRGPRIALSNGSIVITATSGNNLFAWRSNDDGKTWLGPDRVNDKDDSAPEGLTGMASNDSEVACTWLDHRDGGTEIFASISQDGGENWGPNSLVYTSPSGAVCECCQPSIAFGTDGNIHVLFRNSLAGNRDMYIADSMDDGQTWSAPAELGSAHWKLDSCPMDGGALSADDDAHVVSIWRRQDTIFRELPSESEDRIGVGVQPWIYGRLGGYGVYLKRRPGALMEFHANEAPKKISDDANDPMVAGPISGSGPVVAVWATSKGDIMEEVLADGDGERKA